MAERRKVCVVLVDRANYGRLKPVMRAIRNSAPLKLQVLAAGTMVLERFDSPVNRVRAEGFEVDAEIYVELEGSTPVTMAKSVGFATIEFASAYQRLQPDVVVVIGDRYEAFAAAVAAAYMNITIVHLQGGEISGSIDESARHAISKLAHFHVPATPRARDYLIRMGEQPATVLDVGCPSSDLARLLPRDVDANLLNQTGSGGSINLHKPYLLAVFHPTTTRFGEERAETETLLASLAELAMPTVLLWPNIDAGANHISKAVRVFRDLERRPWLRLITNLSPNDYLHVLARTACAVGNSSSFVRDAGYFGTPVVLLGDRQNCRESGDHVSRVPVDHASIVTQVRRQLSHGRYPPCTLYGDGYVAERVASKIADLSPYTQKTLGFATDAHSGR